MVNYTTKSFENQGQTVVHFRIKWEMKYFSIAQVAYFAKINDFLGFFKLENLLTISAIPVG